MQNVTLYYREGLSDKVYQASIEPKNGLFVVNFAYGRRGSTLNTGTKTNAPVDEKTASSTFNKLVAEKKAKGYTPGPDGTPYQHTEQENRVSGYLPQLLSPIEEQQVENYLVNPDWVMQEKFDGKRLLIKKELDVITGINRKGLTVGLPEALIQDCQQIECNAVLDGEIVGETFYAFDVLEVNHGSVKDLEYQARLAVLSDLIPKGFLRHLKIVITCREELVKRKHFDLLRRVKAEGVVFKKKDGLYVPGRPATGGTQMKFKFHATASFIVAGVNGSKRSIRIALLDVGVLKDAGNVTIPANHEIPAKGEIVEVRYLYAFPESGCVYQPVYLGIRSDLVSTDCSPAQLKFKKQDEEV